MFATVTGSCPRGAPKRRRVIKRATRNLRRSASQGSTAVAQSILPYVFSSFCLVTVETASRQTAARRKALGRSSAFVQNANRSPRRMEFSVSFGLKSSSSGVATDSSIILLTKSWSHRTGGLHVPKRLDLAAMIAGKDMNHSPKYCCASALSFNNPILPKRLLTTLNTKRSPKSGLKRWTSISLLSLVLSQRQTPSPPDLGSQYLANRANVRQTGLDSLLFKTASGTSASMLSPVAASYVSIQAIASAAHGVRGAELSSCSC
mmetsp:Transcript_14508/g.29821  ORF Transcript_14508/g.29821 Transcript_14508/m.29821 type:complete len:262 (-) Transcript_14508:79-864(-)